jgi:transposase
MARLPRGGDLLEKAQGMLAGTEDANELRTLQAVVFPLAHGMSLQETGMAIGRCVRWTTDARNKFIKAKGEPEEPRPKMRSRAYLTEEEEAAFLEPFTEGARRGEMLVIGAIQRALEARLGHRVAKATAYNLLHRHGWRKLAPDKLHVSADPAAQEEWKKKRPKRSGRSRKSGRARARSG